MNVTALALLGMAVGLGQPSTDYYPVKARSLKLDIDFKADERPNILQVQLCVSRDQGQTWEVADAVTADKDHFVFAAKEDGPYWVTMLIVFRDGTKDPVHPSKAKPDRIQQLLVDATPPTVRVTSAKRDGDDVVVEWAVEDTYPSNAAAKLAFKPSGAVGTDWQPVSPTAVQGKTARFNPNTAGPIVVQVTAQDLAGNVNTGTLEVGVGAAPGGVAQTAGSETKSTAFASPPGGLIVPTLMEPGKTSVPKIEPTPAPSGPGAGGISLPGVGSMPPPVIPPAGTAPAMPSLAPAPVPALPSAPATAAPTWNPAPAAVVESAPGQQIIATGAGTAGPAPAAVPSNVKAINFLRFDLQYQLENGPSGVRQIDLYVTRDDGRTWTRWSQHDGRENPLRVTLDSRYNTQPEGDYGLRLVPFSGAGLSDGAPTPGTPPEMKVHVDVTSPTIKVFAPTADAVQRNALTLRWEATDRNFGKDPILIEWSELPTGPWKPVAGGDQFPALGALGQPAAANRIANTGSYAWNLPASLTTHQVYLKFTAWDVAGNRSEVATPSPVLVDLTKPRAKISGITTGIVAPR